jgi:hypothetical protein
MYMYEQQEGTWYQCYITDCKDLDVLWIEIVGTPKIRVKTYTGIGTRELNKRGEDAIRALFDL